MKTLREYLNSKYPNQEEKKFLATVLNIKKINQEREEQGINEKLEGGELDLKEYCHLVRIKICGTHLKTPLTKLELGQQKYLAKIILCHNQLTNINLSSCPNLVELEGSNNKLSSIDLSRHKQLTNINLDNNQLTSIDFLTKLPNPEKLITLHIYDNNIRPTNLEFLRPFVNLKDCKLGLNSANKDYPGRIEVNFYNRFYGSLEPIKNLTKLKEFCIAGTDVEEGIEYIPELITKLSHGVLEDSNDEISIFFNRLLRKDSSRRVNNMEMNLIDCQVLRPGAKVKKIQDELRPFNYDILAWQLAHPKKMLEVRPELFTNPESKEQWLNALEKKTQSSIQELSEIKKEEKPSKAVRLETKINKLQKTKKFISQQTQTEFSTQDKSTQTDLTNQEELQKEILKKENQFENQLKLSLEIEKKLRETKS